MEENIYDRNRQSNEASPNLFDLERKDLVMAALICLTTIAFSMYALWGNFQAGYFAASIALFAVATAYLSCRGTKLKAYPLMCGILSCMLSAVFFVTSNVSVRFWSVLAIGVMHCVWFASLAGCSVQDGDIGLIKSVFGWLTKGMFREMPKSMASLFCIKSKRRATIGKALIGVALALPVLLVVLPLLISSDAAFSGFAGKVADNMGQKIGQIIVGLLIVPFPIAFFFAMKKNREATAREHKFKGFEDPIIVAFLAMLSVCYLAYLFSQLAYFFSAFRGFLPEGYAFQVSEYARRGFFEMSAIAAINFVIIFAALLLSRKKDGKMSLTARLLCLFISLFTLIIIATALSKMWLYIGSFGMTVRRITTSAFMVFLAVVFLSLILRLFLPKVRVLQTALLTASCILLVLGICNVNRVVVRYNFEAYKSGALESIDVEHLKKMGDEAVPYLVKLTTDSDARTAEDAREILLSKIKTEYYHTVRDYKESRYIVNERRYTNIGASSLPRGKAYRMLEEYIRQNPANFVFEE